MNHGDFPVRYVHRWGFHGVSVNAGTPIAGWFIMETYHQKWMITIGVSPWVRKPLNHVSHGWPFVVNRGIPMNHGDFPPLCQFTRAACWFRQIRKNAKKSLGMMTFPIYGTSNQRGYLGSLIPPNQPRGKGVDPLVNLLLHSFQKPRLKTAFGFWPWGKTGGNMGIQWD